MDGESRAATGTGESLASLARRIERRARQSDEYMLEAAALIREARRRVEAGQAGKGIRWSAWAGANIRLGKTQLRLLMRIAEADDAKAELQRQRRLIRRRVDEYRERKQAEAAALEPERKQLIAWARKAPIREVRQVLERVTSPTQRAAAA